MFADVCQSLMVVSYWMPGSPQIQAASAILRRISRALYVPAALPVVRSWVTQSPSRSTARMNSSVTRTRVVGVLEEDDPVRLAGEAGVVARLDQRPGLLLLVGLAVDEVEDVRVIGVEDDHLGRPTGRAARLDDARERVDSRA